MATINIAGHIQLTTAEKSAKHLEWPLIESYIWDIGGDEDIERLIDKALRILLTHPEFEKFIWKNEQTLSKMYNDQSFGEVASQIHKIIQKITQERVVLLIEDRSAFSNIKGLFKNKFISGKNDLEFDMETFEQDEKELQAMTDEELYGLDESESDRLAQKYAFWNISVYNELKKSFGINTKARESYLWSFLLSIACCIKYLEIEILAIPQFDIKISSKSQKDQEKIAWKGFVIPPTDGHASINYHLDDQVGVGQDIMTNLKQFAMIKIERKEQYLDDRNAEHCAGCVVRMTEINWVINNRPYCSHCIKFRVYQEYVRKFVIEYDNAETREDLWPWFENNKNQNDQLQYKAILDMYSDQAITIGTILESNLKYYIPRSKTLDAAKLRSGANHQSEFMSAEQETKNLLIKSRTQFEAYSHRNIRNLRKFAGMFLLGDREIMKHLSALEIYLRKKRYGTNQHVQVLESTVADFKITTDDRMHIRQLLQHETTQQLLYGKHGMDRINEMQQGTIQQLFYGKHGMDRINEMQQGTKLDGNKLDGNKLDEDTNRFKRAQSEAVSNLNECRPGIIQFLKLWSRLPTWWEPLHDALLLELALSYQLNISKYSKQLSEGTYYQHELECHYYLAFKAWCSKTVNVQHRLRFLLHIIDHREYPESVIFMNKNMKYSHLNFIKVSEINTNKENGDEKDTKQSESNQENHVKPVRNIEREFRDIVQLLEPEALGERIWRFTMQQIVAKHRESLWKILIILAEELPSNITLSSLETDNDLWMKIGPKKTFDISKLIIRCSNYPVATALYLSGYFTLTSVVDPLRVEWKRYAERCEEIALSFVQEIESDHLLALLLEIPTDIENQSTIAVGLKNDCLRFFGDHKIQRIMQRMWYQPEFLNPNIPFLNVPDNWAAIWTRMWKSPTMFYWSPAGYYFVSCFLYLVYLVMISVATVLGIYPYSDVTTLEIAIWITVVQFVLFELTEVASKGIQRYFNNRSGMNQIDCIMSINWIVLFIMRFFAEKIVGDNYYVLKDDTTNDMQYDAIYSTVSVSESCCSPESNDLTYNVIYMIFWSVQIIFSWIRVITLFRMGPLLGVVGTIVFEIYNILIIAGTIFIGYMFALYFVIAGDLSETNDDDLSQPLDTIRGVAMFCFQMVLGQQDWDVLDSEQHFGGFRAWFATALAVTFIIILTVLVFNLILAFMVMKFEESSDTMQLEHVFAEAELTFDVVRQGYSMPAPFNIFALAIWFLITLINMLFKAVSCGRCTLNLNVIYTPLNFKCLRRKYAYSNETVEKYELYDYSAKVKNEITEDLQRFESTSETNIKFEQLSSLFEKISDIDDTKNRYCKHCYCPMRSIKDGKVDDYFEMFESNPNTFSLDKDDMQLIKWKFNSALCPQCFRPFRIWKNLKGVNIETDRYDRHRVLIEVTSCYVFLIFIWIPFCICLLLPALISWMREACRKRSENKGKLTDRIISFNHPKIGAFNSKIMERIDNLELINKNQTPNDQYLNSKTYVNDELCNKDDKQKKTRHLTTLESLQKQRQQYNEDKMQKKEKEKNVSEILMSTSELTTSMRNVRSELNTLRNDDIKIEEEEEQQTNNEKVSLEENDNETHDEKP